MKFEREPRLGPAAGRGLVMGGHCRILGINRPVRHCTDIVQATKVLHIPYSGRESLT